MQVKYKYLKIVFTGLDVLTFQNALLTTEL